MTLWLGSFRFRRPVVRVVGKSQRNSRRQARFFKRRRVLKLNWSWRYWQTNSSPREFFYFRNIGSGIYCLTSVREKARWSAQNIRNNPEEAKRLGAGAAVAVPLPPSAGQANHVSSIEYVCALVSSSPMVSRGPARTLPLQPRAPFPSSSRPSGHQKM